MYIRPKFPFLQQ